MGAIGNVERVVDPAEIAATLEDPALLGITRLTAAETVRARVGLAIELGLLRDGDRLPADSEIAAALEVSPSTARRALESLTDEGVLVRRRGRGGGTFVSSSDGAIAADAVNAYRSDAGTVHALIDKRCLLECALTHHAALHATDDQLAQLDSLVADAANARSWADYHEADEKFHLAVARAADREWAMPSYTDVLYALYHYFIPYPVEYLHQVNAEHAQLVAALRQQDPVKAVDLMEQHISTLHRSMFVGFPQSSE